MLLKVGELARRSGITVRTLHHYHSIGLLIPLRAQRPAIDCTTGRVLLACTTFKPYGEWE